VSASRTFLARSGMSPTVTADGYLVFGERGPDIYATVRRRGLRVDWEIHAGPTGEPYAWGRTWTQGGADVEAIAAAHRPCVAQEVAR
jgi:hypothetical protein